MSLYEQVQNTKGFTDRVALISTIDMTKESQPWCFTQHFDDIRDQSDPFLAAKMVAEAYSKSGLIIIESMYSYYKNEFTTIMDLFSDPDNGDACDQVSQWLLKRAFADVGFMHAADCSPDQLRKLYNRVGYTKFRSEE